MIFVVLGLMRSCCREKLYDALSEKKAVARHGTCFGNRLC